MLKKITVLVIVSFMLIGIFASQAFAGKTYSAEELRAWQATLDERDRTAEAEYRSNGSFYHSTLEYERRVRAQLAAERADIARQRAELDAAWKAYYAAAAQSAPAPGYFTPAPAPAPVYVAPAPQVYVAPAYPVDVYPYFWGGLYYYPFWGGSAWYYRAYRGPIHDWRGPALRHRGPAPANWRGGHAGGQRMQPRANYAQQRPMFGGGRVGGHAPAAPQRPNYGSHGGGQHGRDQHQQRR